MLREGSSPVSAALFSLPEAAQRLQAFAGSLCTKTGRGDGAGFWPANQGSSWLMWGRGRGEAQHEFQPRWCIAPGLL